MQEQQLVNLGLCNNLLITAVDPHIQIQDAGFYYGMLYLFLWDALKLFSGAYELHVSLAPFM